MFTLPAVLEYLIVGAAAALLYGLCAFGMLGALQQAGYGSGGKRLTGSCTYRTCS